MFTSFFSENYRERRVITANTKRILQTLAVELGERTIRRKENLDGARRFINQYFAECGHRPEEQVYSIDNNDVANIFVEIPGFEQPQNIVVIGAHYDTVMNTPGADDNASAIAVLLELCRLLGRYQYKKTVRFVAFTLEEPPYFATDFMGSMVYAAECKKKKENIELMVCLEMMGYANKKYRQDFPTQDMKKRYPPYGDFLGVFSLPSCTDYVYLWKKLYNDHAKHKIHEVIGPASIPGMDLSDHQSFIKKGFPAIMLSDTGFYRNKNYHTEGDTEDIINYQFLVENTMNSYEALRTLLNMDPIPNSRS